MCQGERGIGSLTFIFVNEEGEEDAIHGGSVLEDAHGSGSSSDFAEASLDGVGGAHGLSLLEGFVAEAGEQYGATIRVLTAEE